MMFPSGEAPWCDLGEVSSVRQEQHHHVRRPKEELPDEPTEWSQNQTFQRGDLTVE